MMPSGVKCLTGRDIKALPNQSQAKSSELPKFPGLWRRVTQALGTDRPGEVANILGISPSSVSEWKNQGKPPALENLLRIAKLGNTSVEWLLTGEGPSPSPNDPGGIAAVYFGEKEQEIIAELAKEADRPFDTKVRDLVFEALKARGLVTDRVEGVSLSFFGKFVPKLRPMRLWGEIAAGKPIEVFERDDTVLVPEEFFVAGRDNFALRVRGDSMEDEGIFEGDFIICYESPVAESGDTVVALIDGTEATVKKFYKEKDRIRLQPKSAKHEPIFVRPEQLTIQGIVTGIFRRL